MLLGTPATRQAVAQHGPRRQVPARQPAGLFLISATWNIGLYICITISRVRRTRDHSHVLGGEAVLIITEALKLSQVKIRRRITL
jgi:hypothetical protein